VNVHSTQSWRRGGGKEHTTGSCIEGQQGRIGDTSRARPLGFFIMTGGQLLWFRTIYSKTQKRLPLLKKAHAMKLVFKLCSN
jgi:hypothetical protein